MGSIQDGLCLIVVLSHHIQSNQLVLSGLVLLEEFNAQIPNPHLNVKGNKEQVLHHTSKDSLVESQLVHDGMGCLQLGNGKEIVGELRQKLRGNQPKKFY